ncbi:MAG: DUF5681 domain-containing protein [Methylococcales bacterium]
MAKFNPGQSANPVGRRPGNVTASRIRGLISDHVEETLQSVIEAAKTGDLVACKILLDRVCPPLKPVSAPLPALSRRKFSKQINELLALLIAGELSPDDTTTLFRTLLHVRQVADNFAFEEMLKGCPPKLQKEHSR